MLDFESQFEGIGLSAKATKKPPVKKSPTKKQITAKPQPKPQPKPALPPAARSGSFQEMQSRAPIRPTVQVSGSARPAAKTAIRPTAQASARAAMPPIRPTVQVKPFVYATLSAPTPLLPKLAPPKLGLTTPAPKLAPPKLGLTTPTPKLTPPKLGLTTPTPKLGLTTPTPKLELAPPKLAPSIPSAGNIALRVKTAAKIAAPAVLTMAKKAPKSLPPKQAKRKAIAVVAPIAKACQCQAKPVVRQLNAKLACHGYPANAATNVLASMYDMQNSLEKAALQRLATHEHQTLTRKHAFEHKVLAQLAKLSAALPLCHPTKTRANLIILRRA